MLQHYSLGGRTLVMPRSGANYYYKRGLLVKVENQVPGHEVSNTIAYSYNKAGLVVASSNPDYPQLGSTFSYDAEGRLIHEQAQRSRGQQEEIAYTYNAAGQLLLEVPKGAGGGTPVSYQYLPNGRLDRITWSMNGSPMCYWQYTYQ